MVVELFGPTFYLLGDTFDRVPLAVGFVAVLEAESVERVLERSGIIDEERGISHVVAVLEFAEELHRRQPISCR